MLKLPSLAATCFAASFVLQPALTATAHADIYKLYTVAYTQSETFAMGDDFGNYAINSSIVFNGQNLCGTSYLQLCYQVGNAITGRRSFSSTIPPGQSDPNPKSPHFDQPTGPNWDILSSVGGLFFGFYQAPDGTLSRGIWDGSNPLTDRISAGSIDGGFVSAAGDVYFIDGLDNTLVFGLDLSTSPVPEPGTLSLTAMALLTSAAAFGRRFRTRQAS